MVLTLPNSVWYCSSAVSFSCWASARSFCAVSSSVACLDCSSSRDLRSSVTSRRKASRSLTRASNRVAVSVSVSASAFASLFFSVGVGVSLATPFVKSDIFFPSGTSVFVEDSSVVSSASESSLSAPSLGCEASVGV